MSDVVELDVLTKLEIPVARVLQAAQDADITEVVVCGLTAEGELYFAASKADAGGILYLIEVAKARLMEACLGEDDD
jgi:hypothetical protein